MRGSVPVGITMFHQVHDSIVKDFKESVIHNLRIIYYNRVETSANKIYSHIRRICANMSKYQHVVAVDFNGKVRFFNVLYFSFVTENKKIFVL